MKFLLFVVLFSLQQVAYSAEACFVRSSEIDCTDIEMLDYLVSKNVAAKSGPTYFATNETARLAKAILEKNYKVVSETLFIKE